MFDLAWSEIALIGVVALVVIGPKDLPEAIRGVARGVQKLRRMAGEFQSHADELVREAKLDEVRNQINEVRSAVSDIRNFDLRTQVEKAVDADGTIRQTFQDDPLKPKTDWSTPVSSPDPAAMEGASAGMTPPAPPPEAPAFIPPAEAERSRLAMPLPVPPPYEPPAPPAFVPPATPEPVSFSAPAPPAPEPQPAPVIASPGEPVPAAAAPAPAHSKA